MAVAEVAGAPAELEAEFISAPDSVFPSASELIAAAVAELAVDSWLSVAEPPDKVSCEPSFWESVLSGEDNGWGAWM